MSRLGFKSAVFHGDLPLGELDVIPVSSHSNFQFPNNEIRIHHLSTPSERCIPLSILQTISPHSVRCKLESSFPLEQTSLIALHASCYHHLQTAVVFIGEEEIHLVAMPSKLKKFPCFWCFSAPVGLYESCLAMLNMRCLAIVFDLDETLIVANTMKSFEDRIETLRAWLARETDPVRVAGMTAEMKRYIDDRMLLKQYTESDCVVDNGKIYKVQMEEVPPFSDNHEKFTRPVIRLQEKNIVLTRINPEIRDTSVLVRLRPAWEELRSYLTAKGRKRFEVHVCTMAERDYALEIWRLLDPDSHLIASKQILDRVVCVKSGCRKSLFTVFQRGTCHPRLAMVIDDRCKVWEDMDQPRVHVVPAFTPYYAPQAETANAVPVLCVARNVACSVRGTFFKDFDEVLLRKISEIFYEDDVLLLPPPPDVSKFLIPEFNERQDAGSVLNGSGTASISEGMEGAEVERNMNQSDEKTASSVPLATMAFEFRSENQRPLASVSDGSSRTTLSSQKVGLLGPPFRRDGCTADQGHEARKGLLPVNLGQDMRNLSSSEPPILSRLPGQEPVSSQSECGWLVEDDSSRGQMNHRLFGSIEEPNGLKFDKQGKANPFCLSNASQVKKGKEATVVNDLQRQNLTFSNQLTDAVALQSQTSLNDRDIQNEAVKPNFLASSLSIEVLQEIGRRCSSKVEFKSIVSTSEDLQFSVEVLFTGEKIGIGMGRTRKDAQQQAAENALRSLAEKYIAYMAPYGEALEKGFGRSSQGNENGFLWDVDAGPSELQIIGGLPKGNASEVSNVEIGVSSDTITTAQKRASPLLQQPAPWKKLKESL